MLPVQAPAPVALSVSPARIAVRAPASRTIRLRNSGLEDVIVEVTRRAVGESGAFKSWVHVVPARQSIRAGSTATFTLRVGRSATATPGDHAAVVFMTTHRAGAAGVSIRLRVGVRLLVRVPGRLVRRIEFGRLRVKGRRIVVPVANRGNVVVSLAPRVTATLLRRGRHVARLRARAPSLLLPGGRVSLVFPYARRFRGVFSAELRVGGVVRRFRLRL
jgi:P pilus assembly chaperone PapD